MVRCDPSYLGGGDIWVKYCSIADYRFRMEMSKVLVLPRPFHGVTDDQKWS